MGSFITRTLECDITGCDATFTGDRNYGQANTAGPIAPLRAQAARAGWTHTKRPAADACPRHS